MTEAMLTVGWDGAEGQCHAAVWGNDLNEVRHNLRELLALLDGNDGQHQVNGRGHFGAPGGFDYDVQAVQP